ncbi:MAG: hypothetical protein E8A49_07000 [Phenylobacterium sp.]|nr:MAG: hypothetical protein E8A49_07000 [Phenylobacterium sp.]
MKPQSARGRLDRGDRAPHPFDMTSPPSPPKDPVSDREAKLAQALRANLRRRKTGAKPQAPGKDDSEQPEET